MNRNRISDVAIVALLAWLDASDRNAQQDNEHWAQGFREVQQTQDALRAYFTTEEITGFIVNKNELRTIIAEYREKD